MAQSATGALFYQAGVKVLVAHWGWAWGLCEVENNSLEIDRGAGIINKNKRTCFLAVMNLILNYKLAQNLNCSGFCVRSVQEPLCSLTRTGHGKRKRFEEVELQKAQS